MADPFIGEIRIFAFNFVPEGWAICEGQQLSVNQNKDLYAVIGTLYRGQAGSFFNLPAMQGLTPMGAGHASGLTPRRMGPVEGNEMVALTSNQVAPHQHQVTAYAAPDPLNAPSATVGLAGTRGQYDFSKADITPRWSTGFAPSAISPTFGNAIGGANPHENRQPYLSLNFCIALLGEVPLIP